MPINSLKETCIHPVIHSARERVKEDSDLMLSPQTLKHFDLPANVLTLFFQSSNLNEKRWLFSLAGRVSHQQNPGFFETIQGRVSLFPRFSHIQEKYDELIDAQTAYLQETNENDLPELSLDLKDTHQVYEESINKHFELLREQEEVHALIINLFGHDRYDQLPVLDIGDNIGKTQYLDFITSEQLTASIMRGADRLGRRFITFKHPSGQGACLILFQRYTDSVDWHTCPVNYSEFAPGFDYMGVFAFVRDNGRTYDIEPNFKDFLSRLITKYLDHTE